MPVQIGSTPAHGFDHPLGMLGDCHRRVEQFLRVLVKVTECAAHGPLAPEQRHALEIAMHYFEQASPIHTLDEEDSLYPRLRRSPDPRASLAVKIMAGLQRDHRVVHSKLQKVLNLGRVWRLDGRLPPADARRLATLLRSLTDIYTRHIRIEDTELFPLAEKVLTADDIAGIGREFAIRHGLLAPAAAR